MSGTISIFTALVTHHVYRQIQTFLFSMKQCVFTNIGPAKSAPVLEKGGPGLQATEAVLVSCKTSLQTLQNTHFFTIPLIKLLQYLAHGVLNSVVTDFPMGLL